MCGLSKDQKCEHSTFEPLKTHTYEPNISLIIIMQNPECYSKI